MKIIYSVEMGDTHYRFRAKWGNISIYHYLWHADWWFMKAESKLTFLAEFQRMAEGGLQL